jgi:trigger factor
MVKSYFEKWSDDLEEKGLFQVRSGLILDKLARDYEIESDESDLDKKLDELAAQSGMEKDQLANYYNGNETLKRNMLYVIREEKTFDRLFQDLKIK